MKGCFGNRLFLLDSIQLGSSDWSVTDTSSLGYHCMQCFDSHSVRIRYLQETKAQCWIQWRRNSWCCCWTERNRAEKRVHTVYLHISAVVRMTSNQKQGKWGKWPSQCWSQTARAKWHQLQKICLSFKRVVISLYVPHCTMHASRSIITLTTHRPSKDRLQVSPGYASVLFLPMITHHWGAGKHWQMSVHFQTCLPGSVHITDYDLFLCWQMDSFWQTATAGFLGRMMMDQ